MPLAHIAGIPVEETVLYFIPLWGILVLQIKSYFKKCDCGKRGCSCSDD